MIDTVRCATCHSQVPADERDGPVCFTCAGEPCERPGCGEPIIAHTADNPLFSPALHGHAPVFTPVDAPTLRCVTCGRDSDDARVTCPLGDDLPMCDDCWGGLQGQPDFVACVRPLVQDLLRAAVERGTAYGADARLGGGAS